MDKEAAKVDSDVLIVGAGPVGMVLALDLASRGVKVVVAERHAPDATPPPRCNHISARSLEIFRRLGLASEIRQAGLPGSYPHDVAYATSLTGYELSRIRIPSRDNRFGTTGYSDSDWPTPEPPHRCNQMYFEPILQRHVLETPNIRMLYRTEIEALTQDDTGVTARGRDLATGEAYEFRADYLVGCDGGSSMVRKTIGARFEGVDIVSGTRSILLRSPDFTAKRKVAPAWMTWVLNPRVFGCVIAMNGDDLWSFHMWMPTGVSDFESLDREQAIRASFGTDFEYEIISTDDWYGRRLVANKFRDRRVFICGDAAHIWIPFAGYGMNAGIADAMSLSWQLAAVVNGWAEPGLLDAYEVERQPVTEQVSRHAMALALKNLDTDFVKKPPAALEHEGPEGDAVRAEAGRFMYDANVGQFACIGLNFGTYYNSSPITAHDGEPAPDYDLTTYRPSTVPGCRTPHIWLNDGSSLYDRMGPEYTLLRSDPDVDVSGLVAAAADRGVPLQVLDLDPSEGGDIYRQKLVLSRPDQHVAWRGDAEPEDPLALIDLIRGAAHREHAEPVREASLSPR